MMAVGLIRAVFQFLLLLGSLGLLAAAAGAGWRLYRGVVLPPVERRRPHFMQPAAAGQEVAAAPAEPAGLLRFFRGMPIPPPERRRPRQMRGPAGTEGPARRA